MGLITKFIIAAKALSTSGRWGLTRLHFGIDEASSGLLPMRAGKVALLVSLLPVALAAANFDIASHYRKVEYRIPMRDGVRLFTIAYIPKDETTKYPILFTRTPYSIAPYGANKFPDHLGPSDRFAQDGFIFVYQDARGRYMSEGRFVDDRAILDSHKSKNDIDESTDAYDSIDWLVKNVPSNNGKVGMVGISYPGFYTATALVDSHPALIAASPQAPMANLYMGDDAYHNGAFFLAANFDFYSEFVKQNNPTLPERHPDFEFGTHDGYKFFLQLGPLRNANSNYFHDRNPYWTDLLQHTAYDRFWQSRDILPHLKSVRPAVLVVGGWYDAEDLAGTLGVFRAIEKQSPQTSLNLVMGPWCHGCWQRQNGDHLGDIHFGSKTSEFFLDNIELPFFRHYLKGAPDPELPKAYVFETGKNEWKRESAWPPREARAEHMYLQQGKGLRMQPPPASTGFDEYVSNPNNPVPFFNKPTVEMAREYMDGDQRFVSNRPDVLTYQTEPLQQDVTFAGPFSPALYVSTTATDSDFDVKLIDVYPGDAGNGLAGYQQLVRGEPFRGKFRNSFESPEPFKPGSVQAIRFTTPDIFHCFLKGHRIMVQIQSSWFPLTDRNPQTFLVIPTAEPRQFVTATQRVYRTASQPSGIQALVLQ
jgi:putative CocE/NonD family hydrolase